MMKPIPIRWPLSSAPGARPQESAGRIINGYAEPLQQESGPAQVVWRRTPGVSRFATSGATGFRGGVLVNNLAFMAFLNSLLTVDSAGAVSNVGTLAGSKPITAARNNLSPTPQIGIVTENGAFLVTSSSIVSWPDADLPQPVCIAFQDGFFFWLIGDRRVFASEPNSTAVNALTFTTLQSRSVGTAMRGVPYNGMMYFFMSTYCEVFQNSAASIPAPAFPYSRLTVIDRGLIGQNAIAGWEEGFGKLMWVADDFGVYRLINGLTPDKVSPPDLDRLIKGVVDRSTIRASCHVHGGHLIWTVTGPTFSWSFNLSTEKWNENWSTTGGLTSMVWRFIGSLGAFDKWLGGSSITGNIVSIDDASFFEETDPLVWRMESGPVKDFPNHMRVGRVDFDFDTGVGIPGGIASQQNPQVAISWSDDGGITWGTPVLRQLGAGQRGKVRVSVVGCGQTQASGRRWRIDVQDAVYVGFLGGTMSASPRAT